MQLRHLHSVGKLQLCISFDSIVLSSHVRMCLSEAMVEEGWMPL